MVAVRFWYYQNLVPSRFEVERHLTGGQVQSRAEVPLYNLKQSYFSSSSGKVIKPTGAKVVLRVPGG